MKTKPYVFILNTDPSQKDLEEALSALYELTCSGAEAYRYQCPIGYEELGAYVFNRLLKMLNTDAVKGGLEMSWQNGLRLWMKDPTWKTAASYVKSMLSSGFIDYTRSVYSEFRQIPTDPQEQFYVFERPDTDESTVTVEDFKEVFSRLSTEKRKALYKTFKLDAAGFADSIRKWFETVCSPKVIKIETIYDLSMNQIHEITSGLLAYALPDGEVYYNIKVVEKNKTLLLSPF